MDQIFFDTIDRELRGSNPPDTWTVAIYLLMLDNDYMTLALSQRLVKPNHNANIAYISNCPSHSLYKKMRAVWRCAQIRRDRAGLSVDPWPIPLNSRHCHVPPSRNRRVMWGIGEVREAYKMWNRFSREKMVPFSVNSVGAPLERMNEFDPCAEEVVFVLAGK